MFVSQGSLVTTKTPISFTNYTSSWFPSMPPMSGGWPSAYAGIYSKQLWVYVVVNKLAKAQARLPFPVYRREEAGRVRVDDHPMAQLLANPNPGMSGYDLWLWTASTKGIYGRTFWLKKRNTSGVVVGLYPLHPSSMMYNEDAKDWTFDNGKLRLDHIADADLVTFRNFHPDSFTDGLSPLEPLRSTLENEWSARTATSSFWQRGARPGMALSHPGTLSEPAIERLRRQMDDVAAGADKTGVTVVLEEGMKPAVMTLTAEEAQYIETRKLNREEVCAAYDVPPPVVHILDHATFSNITEQMRSMYRDTMGGILPADEAAIEVHLRQAEWPQDDVYAEFLMDEVLRGDFETRQDALAKAAHMTIAEKRRVENLPFIEGTDRIFLNTATMPLDAIDAQSAALVAQTADRTLTPLPVSVNSVSTAVIRSVMGRLSWQKELSQVETHAVTDGLDPLNAGAISAIIDAERETGGSVGSLRKRIAALGKAHTKAKLKTPDTTTHENAVRTTLEAFFERQGKSVLSSGTFDTAKWDADLTDDLHATAVAVSSAVGKATMRELGYSASEYNVERTVDFLRAVAGRLASTINDTTKTQFDAAKADSQGDPSQVFEMAKTSRATGISIGVTTLVANFAVTESGKRIAEAEGVKPTKTWITGRNPRPEHAAMDGETVGIDDTFSDGNDWPGGEPGCNCSVEIDF